MYEAVWNELPPYEWNMKEIKITQLSGMWCGGNLAEKVYTDGRKECVSSEHLPWKYEQSSERLLAFPLWEEVLGRETIHHLQGHAR